MKNKILCLLEGFVDLGVVKSIQENIDCDLYALIDTNKQLKKFFQEQRLVEFNKIWYYRDHVIKSNQKPDLKYLSHFEEKYHINLWLIAYADRNFYEHNPYHKFTSNEILLIFEQECKLFEQILDEVQPDFVILKSPDYNQSQLLFELCKSKDIKLLTLSHSRFPYRCIISEETDKIDNYEKIINNYGTTNQKTFEELQNLMKGYYLQTSAVKNEHRASMKKKLKGSLKYFLSVCNSEYRQYYVNFGRTRLHVLSNEISLYLKKLYREFFIKKYFKHKIDENVPFVYFPLHFQPERSTLFVTPFYTNQLEVLSNVARSLPVEYKLYVKEHPVQVLNGWRNISFYKSILSMPNVELLHPSLPNESLLKNCSLVITITGTLALEAAFYRKPSIIFGDVIFSELPSVYRIKNLEELPRAIKSSLNKEVHLSDLNKYVSCVIENSFEFDNFGLDAQLHNRFFYGGFLFDVYVPTNDVISVIKENKLIFDKLSSEYIKKIKEHQNKIGTS